MQRYVRSWNTSRYGADIVSVPPQPRRASLNGGEPRSNSDALATAMFARMRWVSWRFSRLVAERRDAGLCRESGEKRVRGLRFKRR